jgi:hypothetical protein
VPTTHTAEAEQLARKMFTLTLLGTCAFAAVVVLVLHLMPNNSGDTAPEVISTQHLTAQR